VSDGRARDRPTAEKTIMVHEHRNTKVLASHHDAREKAPISTDKSAFWLENYPATGPGIGQRCPHVRPRRDKDARMNQTPINEMRPRAAACIACCLIPANGVKQIAVLQSTDKLAKCVSLGEWIHNLVEFL